MRLLIFYLGSRAEGLGEILLDFLAKSVRLPSQFISIDVPATFFCQDPSEAIL
jgi:hypothetical protein